MSEIRVNTFKAEDGISAPSFPNGIQVTGVVTATVLDSTVPFLSVGNNIHLGNAGVATATTFNGNLTGNATGLSGTPNITVGSVVATTGTFSGNVSIGGTLTYEDVVNVDSVGIVTARSGVNITGGNINLGDSGGTTNHRLNLGADTDMSLYHNGAHGVISNTTGNLHIMDDSIKLQNADSTTRLEVTTSGVDVTGTLTATGSISDDKGDVRKIIMKTNGANNYNLIASDVGKAIHSSADVVVPNSVFSAGDAVTLINSCLLYTSPSPRDVEESRMPSSA